MVGDNAHAVDTVRMQARFAQPAAVYLWGPDGCGRSHLLHAAVFEARAGGRPAGLADQIMADGDYPLPCGGLLAVDDVQTLTPEAQAALFRAFLRAPAAGVSLLLAGNAPPGALALRDDVRTRIGQCLVFELRPLDDANLAEMLALYGLARGVLLEPDLLNWLLHHSPRDVPSLLATLDRLDDTSLARHRVPSLPLLRELVGARALPQETA